MTFRDRADAGRQLAGRLEALRDSDTVVVGLPRGGVAVAAEVARELSLPLDVIVVRKLGVPYHPELAMGAVGEDGVAVVNHDVVHRVGVSERDLRTAEEAERAELERRVTRFRGGRPRVKLGGRNVVVVDDGIATGATARAACQVAQAQGARSVVLAVPVAPPDATSTFSDVADEVVVVMAPERLIAIGQWYDDFTQASDDEVMSLLAAAPVEPSSTGAATSGMALDTEVEVSTEAVRLGGQLTVPEGALGLVAFAHGSGSGRHSPRNQQVAAALQQAGLGTLLLDLLTADEEDDRDKVFDIDLLADRLRSSVHWLAEQGVTDGRSVGLFGASTGAAAALVASVELVSSTTPVRAVVSRGGRPDLAGGRLTEVRAPTLLIVGSRDPVVMRLNRDAERQLAGQTQLSVVPGATHLFEEPGTLDQVADLASGWFREHLTRPA